MIILNKDYVIDCDELNYAVKQNTHRKDKHGNTVFRTLGYYSNLKQAILGAKEYETRILLSKGEMSLYDALTSVRTLSDEFMDILNRVLESEEK